MRRPTVLLIEPDVVLRHLIEDCMSARWTVHTAANAYLAIPLIPTLRPDVVITDAQLPFVSGIQLCEIVKDRYATTAVIVTSRELEALPLALRARADAVLAKPIAAQRIAEVAARLVRRSRSGGSGRQPGQAPRPCPFCARGPAVRVVLGADRRGAYSACGSCMRIWRERLSPGRRRADAS